MTGARGSRTRTTGASFAGLAACVLVLAACAAPPDVARPTAGEPPSASATPAPPVAGDAAPPAPSTSSAADADAAPASRTGTVPPARLPGWSRDTFAGLREALLRQCAQPRPPAPWPALCAELRALPAADGAAARTGERASPAASANASPATGDAPLREWIGRRFVARALAAGGNDEGLITGYHEPIVTGSRVRDRDGQVPLYRRPADLQRTPGDAAARSRASGARPLPYWTRTEIERDGVLAGQELVWVDDPIEAFFLQVQGSGRVRLRDGTVMHVGFADHNGHPYRAIGRVLVERGEMRVAEADADAIKAWLRTHPAQATEVMRQNARYVFFRETSAGAGPIGSLGVPLTPLRSVATDPRVVAAGALMWLQTTRPDDGAPIERAVVSQDTGAAITGTVRADLFWGSGEQADRMAALMKQRGRLWWLQPVP